MKWAATLSMILICCAAAPAAEKQHLTLATRTLKVTFDLANHGNIVSLRSEGIEVVSNPQKALLFMISLVSGNRSRYYSNQDFEQFETRKSGLPYEFAGKLPQKRKLLIVQVEFGKILALKG